MTLDTRCPTLPGETPVLSRLLAALLTCQILSGCQMPSPMSSNTRRPVASVNTAVAGVEPYTTDVRASRQRLSQAASLMHAGKHESAREELVEMLAVNPSDTSAVELLAEVSLKLNDHRLHRAALARLLALQPKSAAVANQTGKRLLTSLRTDPATEFHTAELSRFPPTATTDRMDRPAEFSNESTRELAITALQLAVELEPRNTLFAQDLFATLIESGRADEAEHVLQKALQRNPRDRILPMAAARLYEARKDWSAAEFYYDFALRNDPANPVWRRQRAVCHFRQGEYEKARNDFSRALTGSPVKPQLSEHLAWAEAAIRTSDHEEAQRVLDLIVTEGELRTADIEVLRGTCLLKQGNVQAAAEIVLKAQLDWPRHPGLWKLAREIESTATAPVISGETTLDLASLSMNQTVR